MVSMVSVFEVIIYGLLFKEKQKKKINSIFLLLIVIMTAKENRLFIQPMNLLVLDRLLLIRASVTLLLILKIK